MYARLSQAQIKLTSLGHIKHNQCQQRWCVRCPDFWAVLAVCDQVQKCSIYRDMVTVVTPHQFSSGGTLDTSHTSYFFTQSGDGSFRNGKDLSCGKQHLTLQVPIKSIHLKNLINYLYDNQYIQHSHRRSFGLKKSGIALVIKMPCFHTISMLVLIGTCLPCVEKFNLSFPENPITNSGHYSFTLPQQWQSSVLSSSQHSTAFRIWLIKILNYSWQTLWHPWDPIWNGNLGILWLYYSFKSWL